MNDLVNDLVKLDPMSDEQKIIFNHIQNGHNVIVDACAGSGKSTTILSIATYSPDKKFIQLTYNSMLCSEIKTKVEKLRIPNLQIYTYHSLTVRYYTPDGYTDTVMRKVLQKNMPLLHSIHDFHVLVIDETQDMTSLYFRLIIKFCTDYNKKIQLLILGDFMQGLYEFKGADIRFLTCADEIWKPFSQLQSDVFHKCTLRTSYRITKPMADFVNKVMLGETRLEAVKDGMPVMYLRQKTMDAEKYIIHVIKQLLADGAVPSDIFILGGSVKGQRSLIRKMENILVEHGIPCHVPMFETEKIDERVINGKVVFSTFHSVKGRQRKYVFVVGFDHSYFTYFARTLNPLYCPNTLYVACTRATHGLWVFERNDPYLYDRPLKFLKLNHYEMKSQPFMKFQGMPQLTFTKSPPETVTNKKITHYTTPTDLIKFLSEDIIEDILPILESIFTVEQEKIHVLDMIPSVIQTNKGYFEDVSDLNGIAIPMMFFDILQQHHLFTSIDTAEIREGGKILHMIITSILNNSHDTEYMFLKEKIKELPEECTTIYHYLHLSNMYVSVREKLYFKLNQIQKDEYNWLSNEMISICFDRMNSILSKECVNAATNEFTANIEKTFIQPQHEELYDVIDRILLEYFPKELFRFTARIDLETDSTVWEIKCTTDITAEHFLQVVVYAWLWRCAVNKGEGEGEGNGEKDFKILNIKSGEIYKLNASLDQLTTIMVAILKGKYGEPEEKEDIDFILTCHQHIMNVDSMNDVDDLANDDLSNNDAYDSFNGLVINEDGDIIDDCDVIDKVINEDVDIIDLTMDDSSSVSDSDSDYIPSSDLSDLSDSDSSIE